MRIAKTLCAVAVALLVATAPAAVLSQPVVARQTQVGAHVFRALGAEAVRQCTDPRPNTFVVPPGMTASVFYIQEFFGGYNCTLAGEYQDKSFTITGPGVNYEWDAHPQGPTQSGGALATLTLGPGTYTLSIIHSGWEANLQLGYTLTGPAPIPIPTATVGPTSTHMATPRPTPRATAPVTKAPSSNTGGLEDPVANKTWAISPGVSAYWRFLSSGGVQGIVGTSVVWTGHWTRLGHYLYRYDFTLAGKSNSEWVRFADPGHVGHATMLTGYPSADMTSAHRSGTLVASSPSAPCTPGGNPFGENNCVQKPATVR